MHIPTYETIGAADKAKPWLTMVHGMSQDRRVFSAQVPVFQRDFRLLLIDLPGHGQSGDVPGPYGLAEFAAGVQAAMDDAGVFTTHYWGTHTGAGVGLLLASRHLERFQTLILEGPTLPGRDLPSVTRDLGRAKNTTRERGLQSAKEEWFTCAGWFEVIRRSPAQCRAAEHWAMIADFPGGPWLDTTPPQMVPPLDSQLTNLTRPVLIVNGERDLEDFLRLSDELEGILPNVQRVRIPGGGGFPLWEFPDSVNLVVRRFLAKAT